MHVDTLESSALEAPRLGAFVSGCALSVQGALANVTIFSQREKVFRVIELAVWMSYN